MKVSDLKTALKRYGFDNKDPLLTWINAAYHEIENAFQRWSFLEKTEEISSSEGEFDLTGNVKRLIKVRDVTEEGSGSGGSATDLEYYDRRAFEREILNRSASGNPEIFTIRGSSTIEVWPKPSTSRTYQVTFIEQLEDLAEENEEPQIPEPNHYTIVRGAAYIALQAENEEERAASAQAQFESDLSKMIDNDQQRQVGEAAHVEDMMDYASS